MNILFVTLLAQYLINAKILDKGSRPDSDIDIFNCSKCLEHTDNFDYLTALDVFSAIGTAINTDLNTKPTVADNGTRFTTMSNTININVTTGSDSSHENLSESTLSSWFVDQNSLSIDKKYSNLCYIMMGLTSFGLILNFLNLFFAILFYVKPFYPGKTYISANTEEKF